MMTSGLVLFAISILPAYIGSVHCHSYSVNNVNLKRSIRYDDELLYRVTSAIYDTVLAREYSMERKALFLHLNKMRISVETRCKLYETLVKNGIYDNNLFTYYSRRIDEFRTILQRFPEY